MRLVIESCSRTSGYDNSMLTGRGVRCEERRTKAALGWADCNSTWYPHAFFNLPSIASLPRQNLIHSRAHIPEIGFVAAA